ncbi:MAG: GAF domain-containing protein [Calditrichaeota bacterium]|nr:GAF domain-containing protein [Calditrichota bacterium]
MEKEEHYKTVVKQVQSLVADENDLIANLANVCAILKESFGFFWVGFYLNKSNELVLGPFQGPLACTRIAIGKGVCGTSAEQRTSIVVPDVHQFAGHIACNANSKSEIVVPIMDEDMVYAVLDIDSDKLNQFDEMDQRYLEEIASILVKHQFIPV